MHSEKDKSTVELSIFREFVAKSPLSIDAATVEKCSGHREPDILCEVTGEGAIAFELVEICDPRLAATITALLAGGVATGSTSDPSVEIIRRKLHKSYETKVPVELLCYTAGRAVSADDQILAEIRPWFDAIDGPFRRAWLLGENGVYEVWRAN